MRKGGFYPGFAAQNIKKNGKYYLPYLLAASLCVAMLYTIFFLNDNGGVSELRGAMYVQVFLSLGTGIITIFSAIIIFYTNGFLMKRRRTEIGLYSVLGMEKRHIARLMLWETIYAALIAIACGSAAGILFSKLALLLLLKLLGETVPFGFEVAWGGILWTAIIFAVIFLLCLASNLRRVGTSKPVELLHSVNEGDREPKTRWFAAVVGVITLGAGYVIALRVSSPSDALLMFFVAVLLVIIGTYLLFTAGSIAILKALRKNKAYYYKTGHFTSVAGMLHRMKRNAAGLASICILSTMVLVTVSTTVCLYLGTEETIDRIYPRDFQIVMAEADENAMNSALASAEKVAENDGITLTDVACVRYYASDDAMGVSQEAGNALKVNSDGGLVWATGDETTLPAAYVGFNVDGDIPNNFGDDILEGMEGPSTYKWANYRDRASNASDLHSMTGGFLFMGLYLGLLFLIATTLIIYYKQVSEGYEDAVGYRIMQQVGMSRAEARVSIGGQIRAVFLLPIAAAAVHIVFAFNMIAKLLEMFSLTNVGLFALCNLFTLLVFAAIYTVVYLATARAYYRIVRVSG